MEPSWPHVPFKIKVAAWTGYFIACFAGSFVIEQWWLFLSYVIFLITLLHIGMHYENKRRDTQLEVLDLVQTDDALCNCKHLMDDHKLIAFYGPENGGFMMCPELGCTCTATWNVPGVGTRCGLCGSKDHQPKECHRMKEIRAALKESQGET